jgi:FAD dependent oxidoreductase
MEDNILETKEQILIIGGGIFGLTTAIVLGEAGYRVTLVEKQNDVMLGASLVNQNRVHYGYHYPRSKATGIEALAGLESFKEFYRESICSTFDKYYAVAKKGSHVTSNEFIEFCQSINLDLKEKWPERGILNEELIDSCWLTPESIFDYHKLKQLAIYRVSKIRNVRVIRNTEPLLILPKTDNSYEIKLTNGYKLNTDFIINTTYSGIPDFANNNNYDPIKGKFQLCVMPILESDYKFKGPFGITIMDGPFCSLMPKGFNDNHFILYHVVHSVIQQHVGYHSVDWSPIDGFVELDIMELSKSYYPIIDKMKLRDAWITTRIVLPDQELDDARPTLVINHKKNVYSIFSGKLTTCVDSARNVLSLIDGKKAI